MTTYRTGGFVPAVRVDAREVVRKLTTRPYVDFCRVRGSLCRA